MSHATPIPPTHPLQLLRRSRGAFALSVLLGLGVIVRAGWLQLRSDERFERMAQRQFQSRVWLKPSRGPILDRNGDSLAVNIEMKSLAADPTKLKTPSARDAAARVLSKALKIDHAKLKQKLSTKREFVWIERGLSDERLGALRNWKVIDGETALVPGLMVVKESRRAYPHGKLASQILGTVNIDSEGLEGVEYHFDETLRGKVASVRAVRDALGRPSIIDAIAAREVQNGGAITLTLDAPLQFAVEHALQEAVDGHRARDGIVIVMNAVTGEILALANAAAPHLGSAHAKRNRALTDGYEPGSTLKPIHLAGALERGMNLNEKIWCERGQMKIQGRTISEAETHEKFEWLSLKEIIRHSSNVGSAKLALKVGAEPLIKNLREFGFGLKTGIEFPGEISGWLPSGARKITPLTLANIGFGQGILVTPLQMIRSYAAFFNGGWRVQPSLVKRDTDERSSKERAPVRILSPGVASQVREALESATGEEGTGKKAVLQGFRVAGKTGTAQVVDPSTKRYSKSRYVASFIGGPLEVEMPVVIFTALDDPRGVYYGSETAAPLFRNVLAAVVHRFGIPGTQTIAQARAPEPSDEVSTNQASPLRFEGANPAGQLSWKMPSLIGLTPREAFQILKGRRFSVQIVGDGLIREQSPAVGASLAEDATVRLTLSDSSP